MDRSSRRADGLALKGCHCSRLGLLDIVTGNNYVLGPAPSRSRTTEPLRRMVTLSD